VIEEILYLSELAVVRFT